MFKEPAPLFQTILANVDRIGRFTQGLNYEAFATDEKTIFAVRAALIELAEAAVGLAPRRKRFVHASLGAVFAAPAMPCGMVTM